VLVKGSRFMKMERVANYFEAGTANASPVVKTNRESNLQEN
jgi:hypothetical protein